MDKAQAKGEISLDITLQGMDKVALTKRVIELEKKGWECISPIKQVRNYHSAFIYKEKGLHQSDKRSYNKFEGFSESVLYKCKMRKDGK